MDDLRLDDHLRDALNWWRGERSARGVSERQAGRCSSCEYRSDCNWRKKKALEKLEEAKFRRQGLNGGT
ncbi:hypothetical protein B0H14DRAFT_2841656 [Mycena olivaceomarginata]|nr:hypothetical protein B0H14DRAFT_2841656 [Mycena olivaceomarginata]